MTTLVLALRGATAAALLLALVGGLPRIVQVGLAVVVGLWSAAVAGPPVPAEALWLVAARELVIGATIGVVAALPLLAVATAGRLVDRAGGALGASGAAAHGPYRALFGLLAATVFVGLDGHVAFVTAIVTSFRDAPAVAATVPGVLATLAGLVPIAARLAVPWLVTVAVVEVAAGVAVRLAGRAAAQGAAGAATPAALVMMTASLVGTLAVGIAALVRGAL